MNEIYYGTRAIILLLDIKIHYMVHKVGSGYYLYPCTFRVGFGHTNTRLLEYFWHGQDAYTFINTYDKARYTTRI